MFDVTMFIKESNAIEGYVGAEAERGTPYFDDHLDAYNYCVDFSVHGRGFGDLLVLETHHRLMKNVMPKGDGLSAFAGKFRDCGVYVGQCTAPNQYLVPALTWKFCEFANKVKSVEDCLASHYLFESIHPFIDGNGRTGRILLNALLLQKGFEQIIIYAEERFGYYANIETWRKRHLASVLFPGFLKGKKAK